MQKKHLSCWWRGIHVVCDLNENGYRIIVYDNLSEGHREAVCENDFVCSDINDSDALNNIFENNKIDAVMHFSAYAYVGESVKNPEKYYKNNTVATINLLSAMLKYNVKNFIFSSTCATYGIPIYTPIDEQHPQPNKSVWRFKNDDRENFGGLWKCLWLEIHSVALFQCRWGASQWENWRKP